MRRLPIQLKILIASIVFFCSPGPVSATDVKPQFKRIVTMAPNLTEVVFALGQGERVVGVSDFDKWPSAVADIPRVGGYYNPNLEAVIKLNPDVVFMIQGREQIDEKLQKLGIKVHVFACDNLASLHQTIGAMGEILGVEAKANELMETIRNGLDQVHVKGAERFSVMICVGMTPGSLQGVYVAGANSIHQDLLNSIGAKNVFNDVTKDYFAVNKESIMARRPDIIIDLIPGQDVPQDHYNQRMATWQLLPGIPAVKAKRIAILNEDYLNIPGPRIVEAATRLKTEIDKWVIEEKE